MTDSKFKLSDPELEAEIYYLSQQEGGRFHYVKSGYHGQFYYNGRDWDAQQELMDKEICNPGETVNVRLQTLSPYFHVGQFYQGQTVEIREGPKTVGHGKITQILRKDFKYWDFERFFAQLPIDCKPYDWQNIGVFSKDVEHSLAKITQIDSLKFTKSLSVKNQLLTVECKIKYQSVQARPLIDEICKSWSEEIQSENSLYKTELHLFNKRFKFELTFAMWHSMYLTGKIIINKT